jgi:hypothetical protein
VAVAEAGRHRGQLDLAREQLHLLGGVLDRVLGEGDEGFVDALALAFDLLACHREVDHATRREQASLRVHLSADDRDLVAVVDLLEQRRRRCVDQAYPGAGQHERTGVGVPAR